MSFNLDKTLEIIPELLRGRVTGFWEKYTEKVTNGGVLSDQALQQEALKVWAMSDFVAQACIRYPEMLDDLVASGDLQQRAPDEYYLSRLTARLDGVLNENQMIEVLRHFRRREMVRIAWRDLAGHAELNEVTRDLSNLAEACTDLSLQQLHQWHSEQWGTPIGAGSEAQQMVVLGMGKLGAHELNFSSDIDLIFSYPEDGETTGARRSISNQEFFIKLGQALIRVLDTNNAYGFVFRVDMRLRPFGEASPLAISFDAMEDYYQVHGREWERYAMIKARVIAGDRVAGKELMARLKPFVYRRYVDFGAFESLREMKAMISREVKRKGLKGNVKLGAGGIREIEFIGQAFQLIRGGREPTLQVRRILTVLEALRGFNLLPDYVVDELTRAYVFLRDTEHRLQAFADQQTHLIPKDEEGQQRLAFSMGFEDWSRFEQMLERTMQRVHEQFEQVFAAPQTEQSENEALDLTGVWQGGLEEERAQALLEEAGFGSGETVYQQLTRMRQGRAFLAMGTEGRQRLDHLMPLLLSAIGQCQTPDETLERLLPIIEAVSRRSAYIALLVENPMALSQLVRLCGASPWIAHQLGRYPLLLDELLDPRTLYTPPKRDQLVNELRQRLLYGPEADLELQMDSLRQFKQANVLRVAAADVAEAVPLMVVSDHLTDIAETILNEVLELAWNSLVARYGRPQCGDELVCDKGFAMVAYGKLGGIELGYGSDLDMVFLHANDSSGRTTDGEKPVDNAVFYARLAQRIIHLLSTQTAAGILYETDMRLRPNGASGLMVSSLEAFES